MSDCGELGDFHFQVEDLDQPGMPENFIELIDGQIAEKVPPGPWHNRVCFHVQSQFRDLCQSRPDLEYGGLGDGFLISRNPDTMLVSDACLFSFSPWPQTPWRAFAPEVWVEVLSPSNSQAEMAFKRRRLFDAGTQQFWVVDPAKRILHVHFPNGRLAVFAGDAEVVCEGFAEGLCFPLPDIFAEQ